MDNELKKKSIRGIKWSFVEVFISHFLKLVIGLILARLLTPEDYGLVAIALIFFTVSEVFIKSGLGQAYIQKSDADEIDANTIFTTNLVVSALFYAILWLTAPIIATYFQQPLLIMLIRVMAFIVIINAFNVIQLAILRKELAFKKKTLYATISYAISGGVGIYCALIGFGVWSLVLQQMLNKFLFALFLFVLSPYKMRLQFSYSAFKPLFEYGSWLLLTNIVIRIFDQIYKFAVGRYYTADALGLFDKGQQFPKLIYQNMTWSVGSVAFPVYTKVNNYKSRANILIKFIKYTLLFSIPTLLCLYLIAEPFVLLLLTEKWAGAIPYLKLFCIIGIIYPIYTYMLQYLEASGNTRVVFFITSLLVGFRLINVWLFIDISIIYIVYGEIISLIIITIISIITANRIAELSIAAFIQHLSKLYLGGIICLVTISWAQNMMGDVTDLVLLTSTSIATLLCYFTIMVFIDTEVKLKATDILKKVTKYER